MASSVFGIDLGTTYSCIAYIDETGNPVVANNMEGSNTTPSVVCFEEGGGVTVGQVAKDGAVFEPDRTVSFVKRSMGVTDVVIYADGDRSPEEVSSYILRKVAEDAAKTTGMEVKDVVITVPAYFGDAERNATKVAGELAGLNVLQIVQEPVAAAIYYGATKSDADTTALVYDLGGGTFDVNVISVSHADGGTNLSVKWTDGDASLGGCDWDAVLMQQLQSEFCNQTGYDDDFDDDAIESFQSAAEATKKALTSKEAHKVTINVGGMPARITVTREEFNELTSHLLRRTMDLTKSCLEQAREKAGVAVDKILLVGGSTRMPQVEAALRAEFPNLPIELADPDEAVAKGAALCALDAAVTVVEAQKAGNTLPSGAPAADIAEDSIARKLQLGSARNIIQYATSKSYGVKTFDEQTGAYCISNLIVKNQPIPVDTHCVSEVGHYCTQEAGQASVNIEVFETDSVDEEVKYDNSFEPIKVQSFELGSTSLPKGAPIDVAFTLNEEGLLSITAIDVTNSKSLDFEVQVSKGLSGDKVAEVKTRALSMAVE